MQFTFEVTITVERTEGKFASREELAEQIMSELESAEPMSLTGDNGGEYEVTEFEISEIDQAAVKERARAIRAYREHKRSKP